MATNTIEANTEFPQVTNEMRNQVDSIYDILEDLKDLKAQDTALKTKLKKLLKPRYFKFNASRQVRNDDPIHIFDIEGNYSQAQLDFVNKYHVDEERFNELKEILGDDIDLFFHKTYDIKLNVDELTPQDRLKFLQTLDETCATYDITPIVEDRFAARDTFHNDRNQHITTADNLRIDAIVPMEIQVTI